MVAKLGQRPSTKKEEKKKGNKVPGTKEGKAKKGKRGKKKTPVPSKSTPKKGGRKTLHGSRRGGVLGPYSLAGTKAGAVRRPGLRKRQDLRPPEEGRVPKLPRSEAKSDRDAADAWGARYTFQQLRGFAANVGIPVPFGITKQDLVYLLWTEGGARHTDITGIPPAPAPPPTVVPPPVVPEGVPPRGAPAPSAEADRIIDDIMSGLTTPAPLRGAPPYPSQWRPPPAPLRGAPAPVFPEAVPPTSRGDDERSDAPLVIDIPSSDESESDTQLGEELPPEQSSSSARPPFEIVESQPPPPRPPQRLRSLLEYGDREKEEEAGFFRNLLASLIPIFTHIPHNPKFTPNLMDLMSMPTPETMAEPLPMNVAPAEAAPPPAPLRPEAVPLHLPVDIDPEDVDAFDEEEQELLRAHEEEQEANRSVLATLQMMRAEQEAEEERLPPPIGSEGRSARLRESLQDAGERYFREQLQRDIRAARQRDIRERDLAEEENARLQDLWERDPPWRVRPPRPNEVLAPRPPSAPAPPAPEMYIPPPTRPLTPTTEALLNVQPPLPSEEFEAPAPVLDEETFRRRMRELDERDRRIEELSRAAEQRMRQREFEENARRQDDDEEFERQQEENRRERQRIADAIAAGAYGGEEEEEAPGAPLRGVEGEKEEEGEAAPPPPVGVPPRPPVAPGPPLVNAAQHEEGNPLPAPPPPPPEPNVPPPPPTTTTLQDLENEIDRLGREVSRRADEREERRRVRDEEVRRAREEARRAMEEVNRERERLIDEQREGLRREWEKAREAREASKEKEFLRQQRELRVAQELAERARARRKLLEERAEARKRAREEAGEPPGPPRAWRRIMEEEEEGAIAPPAPEGDAKLGQSSTPAERTSQEAPRPTAPPLLAGSKRKRLSAAVRDDEAELLAKVQRLAGDVPGDPESAAIFNPAAMALAERERNPSKDVGSGPLGRISRQDRWLEELERDRRLKAALYDQRLLGEPGYLPTTGVKRKGSAYDLPPSEVRRMIETQGPDPTKTLSEALVEEVAEKAGKKIEKIIEKQAGEALSKRAEQAAKRLKMGNKKKARSLEEPAKKLTKPPKKATPRQQTPRRERRRKESELSHVERLRKAREKEEDPDKASHPDDTKRRPFGRK